MKIPNAWLCIGLAATLPLSRGAINPLSAFQKHGDDSLADIPTTILSNSLEFPLVGLGVGNLQADRVENMVFEGLNKETQVHLIDTAHASRNEKEVAKGIVNGVKRLQDSREGGSPVQVHVVTKVWYTYLGYERTKISVRESLEDLSTAIEDPSVDLKVHILLHWPRCYEGVQWMNCEEEERNLPSAVKQAGPAPHLDKNNAWKESWKALEDMYNSDDYPAIASIGVSNFNLDDMKALVEMASVHPHMTQLNVWSLLNDPNLVDVCNRNNIHIQVYNVMNGILGSAFATPHAHHHLLMTANQVHQDATAEIPTVTAAQVVLKWLVQFGMSVIPRTSSAQRLAENSAASLQTLPTLSENRLEVVGRSVAAMLSGKDVDDDVFVEVTFHALTHDMFLYSIVNGADDEQVAYIARGETFLQQCHPHQKYRLYHAYDPDVYHDYTVDGKYGDHLEVPVEL